MKKEANVAMVNADHHHSKTLNKVVMYEAQFKQIQSNQVVFCSSM